MSNSNNQKNINNIDKSQDLRSLGTINKLSIKQSDIKKSQKNWIGERIDKYLSNCYPFLSRTAWQKKCRQQKVIVLGKKHLNSSYKLKLNDRVYHLYEEKDSLEPKIYKKTRLLCFYHTKNLIAIYKPPDIAMHETGIYKKNTLVNLINNQIGNNWHAVHRLDMPTSGIILCSNSKDLRAAISTMFRYHQFNKTYLAIVYGKLKKHHTWQVDAAIGYDNNTSWRQKRWVNHKTGKKAITNFKVLHSHQDVSLVKINPIQGKTHQIRIHLAYCGYPIIGDTRYFAHENIFLEYLAKGFSDNVLKHIKAIRLCLHASGLLFDYNYTKDYINNTRLYKKQRIELTRSLALIKNYCDNNQQISLKLDMPYDMRYIYLKLLANKQMIKSIPKRLERKYGAKRGI